MSFSFNNFYHRPRNRNTKNTRMLLLIVLVAISLMHTVEAIPAGFIDRGNFTTHVTQRMDWLDVTETVNRGYLDIETELLSGTGLGAAGWRFATDQELQLMLSSYFSIDFMGGPFSAAPFGPGQNLIVNEFISIFGDTVQTFLDMSPGDVNSNSIGVLPFGTTSGYTNGYFLSFGGVSAQARFVFDFEITQRDGSLNDFNDGINAHRVDANVPFTDLGAWLVRSTAIPEPATWALTLMGFTIIARKKLFTKSPY